MGKRLKSIYNTHLLTLLPFQKLKQFIWRRKIIAAGKNIPDLISMVEKSGVIPLFSYVEIETVNRCNGVCSFCPVNKKDDPRDYCKMSSSLFDKIISELQSLSFSGTLSLFSNNEPFLDERIEDFAEKAREALPKAHIKIYTNGTLLTLGRFLKVIPFIDELKIDNYNDDLVYNKTTQVIHDYCAQHPDIAKKVSIDLIRINVVRSTRGGQAPNNKRTKTLPISCLMPYNQMIIRPDGKLSLCCQDAFGKFTLGDVSKETMLQAWHSSQYKEVREALKKGRQSLELCRYCDAWHYGVTDIGHCAAAE